MTSSLPQGTPTPRCRHCGYQLSGLRVDANCPECGQPIWSAASNSHLDTLAGSVQVWGILSLVLLFVCLGPFAGFLSIPAFMAARSFNLESNNGLDATPAARSMVKVGRICAIISAVISILAVLFYVIIFGLMLIP